MRQNAGKQIAVTGLEDAGLVADRDLQPPLDHQSALLSLVGKRHATAVGARLIGLVQDLQAGEISVNLKLR